MPSVSPAVLASPSAGLPANPWLYRTEGRLPVERGGWACLPQERRDREGAGAEQTHCDMG